MFFTSSYLIFSRRLIYIYNALAFKLSPARIISYLFVLRARIDIFSSIYRSIYRPSSDTIRAQLTCPSMPGACISNRVILYTIKKRITCRNNIFIKYFYLQFFNDSSNRSKFHFMTRRYN